MPLLKRRRLLRTLAASGTVGIGGLAGCLDDKTVVTTQEVALSGDGFDPRNIEVDRQKTVFWENVSDTQYLLVSATGTWDFYQPLDPGKTTGFTFNRSDIYKLVARESEGEKTPTTTPTGTPEFTGTRMKIAVGREMQDPVTE